MKNSIKWLLGAWGRKRASKMAWAWKQVFDLNDENIKLIMQDLALYCNVYKSSFVQNDPNLTSFNEGARDAFLHILEMANLKPEDIFQLLEKSSLNND